MKKFLVFMLVSAMMLGFTACNNSGDELVIGLDDSFPPMGFRDDNNEIAGFDIDLAKAAAEKMNMKVKFQPIDWGSKELEIQNDKIDLIWNGFSITPEREETFELTKAYLNNNQVIIVPANSTIKSKAELAGLAIGVQNNSSAYDAIKKDDVYSRLGTITPYDTNILAFQDLTIGRIDAVVADEVVAKYFISQHPETNLISIEEDNFGSEQYAIAAKKGNTELIEKLQKAIDEINADGTSAEISNKWFGQDIIVK